MLTDIKPEDKFGDDYKNHDLFSKLELIVKFYDSLSFSVFSIIRFGTNQIFNLDSYFFKSIKGTIDSIQLLLRIGRINDAYSLLRKYYDSTIINIYTGLYLDENYSIENLIVEKIEKWRNGTESIPDYRSISNYISNSPKLGEINKLLKIDDRYKKIRVRCNDNTHYNFYRNVLLNDNEVHNPNRIKYLDIISNYSTSFSGMYFQDFIKPDFLAIFANKKISGCAIRLSEGLKFQTQKHRGDLFITHTLLVGK
ncbi:MAG: hypothetical protein PF440_04940 [Thiomicrorhabdus sp.]|jgi:hypothetical protein|nr:hypothetical protein [Thiomicrorhabdus sp.]